MYHDNPHSRPAHSSNLWRVFFTLMLLLPLAATNEALAQHRGDLEGLWHVNGTPENGAPIGPFQNFVTIGRDGQIVNVDPETGAGVGESFRIGHNRYAVGFFGYIDAGGGMKWQYEVQGTVRVIGPMKLRGKFRTLVRDLDGNLMFAYKGKLKGQRLSAQPF